MFTSFSNHRITIQSGASIPFPLAFQASPITLCIRYDRLCEYVVSAAHLHRQLSIWKEWIQSVEENKYKFC